MLKTVCYVGIGSFAGGVLRYLVYLGVEAVKWNSAWATFAVNVFGCLLLGFICGLVREGCSLSDNMRLLLTVGICGGFTTFSTFVNDGFQLLQSARVAPALFSTLGGLLAGFCMLGLGYCLGNVLMHTIKA